RDDDPQEPGFGVRHGRGGAAGPAVTDPVARAALHGADPCTVVGVGRRHTGRGTTRDRTPRIADLGFGGFAVTGGRAAAPAAVTDRTTRYPSTRRRATRARHGLAPDRA